MNLGLDEGTAAAIAARKDIVWHQRFGLSESIETPGSNPIEFLLDMLALPDRLDGLSVLDVGTTNGGAAFLAESRGAARVVAVDIYPPDRFGFDVIAHAIGSRAEFIRASIYELPQRLLDRFDVVIFYGVLYHLRHPLLAVDALHALTGGVLGVETAISPGAAGDPSSAEFYAGPYRGDPSNWFVPSAACAQDWFASSGFTVEEVRTWPTEQPSRAFLRCRPDDRVYFREASYEVPLRVAPE